MGITYPTLRKRLDELIASLTAKRQEDEQQIEATLNQMESQAIKPQVGIRIIKEIKNEL